MELITGTYKALEEDFLKYFSDIKKDPLEKVLIITQSQRLNQRLKEKILASKECLSCVFWQDILGLVSSINQASSNYVPLKQKSALDYFKLKNFFEENNLNSSFGYIKALEASFMDMQNALIMPEDLLKIEEFAPSLYSKDLKDLIFVYQNYLKLNTQPGKSSYKDFFTTALEHVEQNSYLAQFKKIIFYGIYDFTSLQYDILKAVGQAYSSVLFFPYEEISSYKYLQDFYLSNIIGIASGHKKTALPKTNLEEASSHLFEVSAEEDLKKYSADVKVIDTSGTLDQLHSAAKEVLLLHKAGFDYKDIAVCARSLEPYKNDIAQVFIQNNIPININLEEAFLTQPLINVCVNLLNIARNNFHRDSVLFFITSPYLKNTHKSWGQVIKDIGVQIGFIQWLNLLDMAIEKGDKAALSLKEFLIDLERKTSLLEQAASFNSLATQAKDIFNTFINLENLDEPEQKLFETLENILDEIASFDTVRSAKKGEFLEEFNSLVEQKTINSVINLQNSLTVADIMNLRGHSFKAVIILGLNEGAFPLKVNEDPVFKDIWRFKLQQLGYNIKVSAQRYLEEKLFFYFALSAASQKAILIFQRCDEEGKLKIPSIYLNWFLRILEKSEKFSLSRRPSEKLLKWYQISPDLLTPQEGAVLAALEGNYKISAELLGRQDLELFLQAFSLRQEGALGARDLVCSPKGPLWQHIVNKGLSPSSLEKLYQCPAKYFFGNIIGRKDTDTLQRDNLDTRDRGILSHRILEKFYKRIKQENLLDKLFLDGALNILQDIIEQEIQTKDYKKYGLYPLLWFVLRKEIAEELKAFVSVDFARIQKNKQEPSYFEEDSSCIVNSLKVHGQIDRIDINKEQNTFSVVDYKSSKNKISGTIRNVIFGEAQFQGPFYFELAKNLPALKDKQADKMSYASLKDSYFNDISYEDYLSFKDFFWTVIDFLKSLIEEGLFIITPSEKSCQYCDYEDICRKSHLASKRRAAYSKQAEKLREFRIKGVAK